MAIVGPFRLAGISTQWAKSVVTYFGVASLEDVHFGVFTWTLKLLILFNQNENEGGIIMKKDNERAVLRYPYNSSVMYTTLNYAVPTAHRAETAARIVDLSDSGMRMLIDEGTLEEGNMLRVRIQISDIQASVPTLAEVIWTKKQDTDAYHAGLRFVV